MVGSAPLPTPLPARCRLLAAGLQPLAQGDLDGLCGLYAILNAVRLLLALERPLSRRETRQLFGCGITFLSLRSQLACSMLVGFDGRLWFKLLKVILAQVQEITGRSITVTWPLRRKGQVDRAALFAAIERVVHAGHPVLVEVEGWRQHFTVVAGYTPASLLLLDSGPLRWLPRKHCDISDEASTARHSIVPRSLMALALG